jgi:hypothetical protein
LSAHGKVPSFDRVKRADSTSEFDEFFDSLSPKERNKLKADKTPNAKIDKAKRMMKEYLKGEKP